MARARKVRLGVDGARRVWVAPSVMRARHVDYRRSAAYGYAYIVRWFRVSRVYAELAQGALLSRDSRAESKNPRIQGSGGSDCSS